MTEPLMRVECYAGYKGDERPLRVHFADSTLKIQAVEDRWYSPGATFFRVVVESGDRYVLRHDDAQDCWSLAAFCSANRIR